MNYLLKDKIIFFTGATSGLGRVSALKAANDGATVLALVRNKEKGKDLLNAFNAQKNEHSGSIILIEGDLSSFDTIRKACSEVRDTYPRIDILVNNAGIMNFEHRKTADNIEATLQVNLLAPILICDLLYDLLKKSDEAKIIFTSSELHKGIIHFDDIESQKSFTSFKVYSQSKLGGILLCRLLAPELEKDQIGLYLQHPGIVKTSLGRDANWFSRIIFSLMGKSPEKGSKTLSYLIDQPKSALKTGEYYADNKVKQTSQESYNMESAQKLIKVVQDYMQKYTSNNSPFSRSI
jgi:NAD(P)-dependent dehydrogenase (short-subunit alcohol dehydrogenase family)